MKKLILIPIVLIGYGCVSYSGKPFVISKFPLQDTNFVLCTFYYDGSGRHAQEFVDSCHKYNVGDTIK